MDLFEIPGDPPNSLLPIHGHRLRMKYFISHRACFFPVKKRVSKSVSILNIGYLHWEKEIFDVRPAGFRWMCLKRSVKYSTELQMETYESLSLQNRL